MGLVKRSIPVYTLLLLTVPGLLVSCGRRVPRSITHPRLAMGTLLEITVWKENPAVKEAFEEVRRIEELFSRFMPESEVSRINDRPGQAVPVCEETLLLIRQALEFNQLTKGAFDVTKKGLPIVVKDSTVTVKEDTEIDLGGIAKGYAVNRIARLLQAAGVKQAMINFGGNIFLIGKPPGKEFWTIGIKDPQQPRQLIGALKLPGGTGIATSANYERPGHIIDPLTGREADECLSVTVVAPSAMTADALSTGVFVLGPEKGMELVEELENVETVIITDEGIAVSSGLQETFMEKQSDI